MATGVGVLGSGLALAAAGMLPRYTVNAETNLAGGDYAALGEAGVLNPPWTLDYLLAQTVGVGSGYHFRAASLGGAVVVLALLALPMARQRFAAPFFAALTLVAMILTLDTTPLHHLFYLIPRYRSSTTTTPGGPWPWRPSAPPCSAGRRLNRCRGGEAGAIGCRWSSCRSCSW